MTALILKSDMATCACMFT